MGQEGAVQLLAGELTLGDQLCHAPVFSLCVAFLLIAELSYYLSVIGHVGVKSKVVDAVLEGEYLRLTVELQIQRVCKFGDSLKAIPEVVFTWVHQVEIIHIAAVILYTQLSYYELVHSVKIEQSEALVYLITERYALALGAIYKQLAEPAYIGIVGEMILHNILQLLMEYVIEELRYVAFEDIALSPVSPIEVFHLFLESMQTKERSFSFLPGTVVTYKYFAETGQYHVVTQAMLYDLVLEGRSLNNALLGLIYLELVIVGYGISFIPQLLDESVYSLEGVDVKPGGAFLVALAAFCATEGFVHVFKVYDPLKIGHTA